MNLNFSPVFSPEGSGSPDPGATGGGKGGFDLSSIPENVRQELIDKGVNIGLGRAKEQFEKQTPAVIDAYLKEAGLSKEDVSTLAPLAKKAGSLGKLFEIYGTDDPDQILAMIDEAENAELSKSELSEKERGEIEEAFNSLQNELEALRTSGTEKESQFGNREKVLLQNIEKKVVHRTLMDEAAAVGAYDPEDIISRLAPFVKMQEKDGEFIPVVLDANGASRFDHDAKPMTIASLVKEFVRDKPHLIKSKLAGGPGGGSPPGPKGGSPDPSALFSAEQIKDPKFFQEHQKEILAAVRSGRVKLNM